MHYRKKHGAQSQQFPLHPLSQLLHSEEASPEPIIFEQSSRFIVHGTSWNGATVGCGVYSHSIPLRGNLQGCAKSRLSPEGLQWGEEVKPRANWTSCKCYWSKESEGVKWGKGVHDRLKEVGIWGAGEWVCVFVCCMLQQDPAGPGTGHMSAVEEGKRPSLRYWPTWSCSCSLGNTVSSSQRHPACVIIVIK